MKITVYLGSAEQKGTIYEEKVRELGRWIAGAGHTLVYGGSRVGLMGKLADAALSAGGEVIGVEPKFLIESCLQHEGITRLIETADMHDRKRTMMELGDAFIAFPGGTGTIEEIAEVISHRRMGIHGKPCILYSLDGYYRELYAMYKKIADSGFMPADGLADILVAESLGDIQGILSGR